MKETKEMIEDAALPLLLFCRRSILLLLQEKFPGVAAADPGGGGLVEEKEVIPLVDLLMNVGAAPSHLLKRGCVRFQN